ncbi:hypothetical protein HMPREF9699_00044 [Bergeyella zoohelcum ATCC 43767]|uniref:Uncharacterized protein n=1 Tax=Bergeyella zoohelcum ATCC 43767 TaxID=883096 RepID=K1LT09_9FLAO|nr:hypothetical protein HMPREF9699_00044 [Bergeyella zoohelcum ATCC 43767]SUV49777.1 Uncharacterised protein [Bergeyella zoohelcum]
MMKKNSTIPSTENLQNWMFCNICETPQLCELYNATTFYALVLSVFLKFKIQLSFVF